MKIFGWILPPRRSFNSSGFPLVNGGRKSIGQKMEEMKPLLSSEKAMMMMDADVFENWKLDGILTIGTLCLNESGTLNLQKQEMKQQQQEEEARQETTDHDLHGEASKEIIILDDGDDGVVESTRPSSDLKIPHSSDDRSSSRGCNSRTDDNILELNEISIDKTQKLKEKMMTTEISTAGEIRRVTLLDLFKADSHAVVKQQLQQDEKDDHHYNEAAASKAKDDQHPKNKTKTKNSKKPLLILSEQPDTSATGPKKSISSKAKKLFSRVKKLDQLMTRMSERKIHPADLNDLRTTTKLEKKGSKKNEHKYYEMMSMPISSTPINS